MSLLVQCSFFNLDGWLLVGLLYGVIGATANAVEPGIEQFVNQFCIKCHQGDEAEGGAALDQLLGNEHTIDRKLWKAVAKNIEFRRMPPEDAEQPNDESRDRVSKLIRQLVDNVDCSGTIDPGAVTLRRLTRYEYRRTVNDLLGHDYEAVDSFPSDDVGYGFDNIGDVLTLSPLLYEKYLLAAESIANSVVGVADGDYRLNLTGAEIEPTLGTNATGNNHMLTSAADLAVPFVVPATGRYQFSLRMSPQQAGPNWVQVGILVDNNSVRTLELQKPTGTIDDHRFERKLEAGRHELVIRFKNDYYQPSAADPNDRDRNLIVHRVSIDGPLDSALEWSDEMIKLARTRDDQIVSSRQFAQRLLTLAYRRIAPDDEVARCVALMKSTGGSQTDQFKTAIKAALISPNFVYRVESNGLPTDRDDVRRLNGFDVASRLSYLFWSTMPDDWLLGEAAAGRLQTDQQLRAVTKRMLADRRSTALIVNFVDQWLQLRRLDGLTKDEKLYPGVDSGLLRSMRRETQMFVASIFRADRSVLDILDADYSYVDGRLAKLYGISNHGSANFRRVELNPAERGGVLTQAAILATTARPTRTSPVMRGKWILETILGDPPPPPAPGVAQLDEAKLDSEASLREMLELHRADKNCAACHEKMDALGFALEEFDAIGAKRSKDAAGRPLDTKAEFSDGSVVHNAAELRKLLRDKYADPFIRCLAEKLFIYAVGRPVTFADECALRSITKQARSEGDRFASLAEGIVLSDAFRKRQVSPPTTEEN